MGSITEQPGVEHAPHRKSLLRRTLAILSLTLIAVFGFTSAAAATGTWSPVEDLSATGEDSEQPQVTSNANGDTVAIWIRPTAGDFYVQSTTRAAGSNTWTPPVNVSTSGGNADYPEIISAPNGDFIAAWTYSDGTNNLIQLSTSSDAGATWSTPTVISSLNQNSDKVQLTSSPNGTLTAVYVLDNGGAPVIQTTRSTDGGVIWSTPDTISAINSQDADVTSDAFNNVTATWTRHDSANTTNIIETTTLLNGSNVWSADARLSSLADDSEAATVVSSPNGNLTVLWEANIASVVYVQASSSTDHGATWSAAVTISELHAGNLSITTLSNSNVVASWDGQDPVDFTDVIWVSILVGGSGAWTTPQIISGNDGEDSQDPSIASSPNNALTIVWAHDDGSDDLAQASYSTDGGTTWSTPVWLSDPGSEAQDVTVSSTPSNTFVAAWSRGEVGPSPAYEIIQTRTLVLDNSNGGGGGSGGLADTGSDSALPLGTAGMLAVLGVLTGSALLLRRRKTNQL